MTNHVEQPVKTMPSGCELSSSPFALISDASVNKIVYMKFVINKKLAKP